MFIKELVRQFLAPVWGGLQALLPFAAIAPVLLEKMQRIVARIVTEPLLVEMGIVVLRLGNRAAIVLPTVGLVLIVGMEPVPLEKM